MKATETLHNVGQSLWLDNITRDLLTSGTLKRYIERFRSRGSRRTRRSSTMRSRRAPRTIMTFAR